MTPTVGRIVHFYPYGWGSKKEQALAAIVTRVWSDECVNLCVFPDGSVHQGSSQIQTSVMHGDSSTRGDVAQWEWPPRV